MATIADCLCYCLELQQKKQENKAPDKDAILKATANLTTRNTDRTVTQHNLRDVRFFSFVYLFFLFIYYYFNYFSFIVN